jgi:acetyltransferase-like isoleucine patch superfamily enzyme
MNVDYTSCGSDSQSVSRSRVRPTLPPWVPDRALRTMMFLRRRLLSSRWKLSRWEVGQHTYGWPVVYDAGEGSRLTIGKYCSVANGTIIMLGGEHRWDWVTTYPFPVLWPEAAHVTGHPATKGDVVIGNDVWIGIGVTILSGVTIGDGAVIGAGSLVSKDVPAYTIAGGNPCRVVRERFTVKQQEALLAMRWWDWPDEVVAEALPKLLSGDVEGLATFAGKRGALSA